MNPIDPSNTGHAADWLDLKPGAGLPDEPALWRVDAGAMRLDQPDMTDGAGFAGLAGLALPGDLLGMDRVHGHKAALIARAVVPTRLRRVPTPDAGTMPELLMEVLGQCQRRAPRTIALRTGNVPERVKRLLLMLAPAGQMAGRAEDRPDGPLACQLPTLKDMAALIDSKPETVSRVLMGLRSMDVLQHRGTRSARFSSDLLRGHRPHRALTTSSPVVRRRLADAETVGIAGA